MKSDWKEHQEKLRQEIVLSLAVPRFVINPTPGEWLFQMNRLCKRNEVLKITLQIDENATDEELVYDVCEIAKEADRIHRSQGGGGLKCDLVRVTKGNLQKPFWISITRLSSPYCLYSRRVGGVGKRFLGFSIRLRLFGYDLI